MESIRLPRFLQALKTRYSIFLTNSLLLLKILIDKFIITQHLIQRQNSVHFP